MSDQQVRVTFQPQGRSVTVMSGTKIVEAAARAGLTLDTPCGGAGVCGKCRVQVTTGQCEPSDHDRSKLSAEELDHGWRLSCQTAIRRDSIIHVPDTSLFASQAQILTEAQKDRTAVQSAVRKIYVELAEPTLEDHAADLQRLEKHVGEFKADLPLLRSLSAAMRKCGFKGTAVLTDHRLIDFEPGDTSAHCYGAAFDIGTTTLVGSLLDLRTGQELGVTSRLNPQVSFGDDVLSRIQYSSATADNLAELNQVTTKAIGEMIDILCGEAKVDRRWVYEIALAGNTTMEHLLCGIDVTQLGHVPFVPVYARGLMVPAAELGVPIAPHGAAYVFPVIGGFVGGDTSAGILATRINELPGPVMMIDIGTNGEIVLAHQGKLWAASTAAGPAFEGARISCGMRATRGAIEKVVLDGDVRLNVIANAAPIGLCGSGLIDAVAELRRVGIVTPEGRMLPPDELPADLCQSLRKRVAMDEKGQPEFLLAAGEGAMRENRVTLTSRDVRELQLATAAIRAGFKILLKQAGLVTSDLQLVLVAGGFGSFIRRSNAQRIGLLPTDIDHKKIHYVGNASLNGARWALVSTLERKRAEQLARETVHVELSQDMDFQMEFAESMIFPE